MYQVFKTAPLSYNTQYIIRKASLKKRAATSVILTKALRFPLCNRDVIGILYQRLMQGETQVVTCELPKRLFRNLNPGRLLKGSDEPLPFLQCLYNMQGLRPDPNSHKGYALTKAVQAGHEPLVRFLLQHGALPSHKDGLCVKIAIRQKNLSLVKMLMERNDKNAEEVVGTKEMLKLAMKCGAWDIAEYLTEEKGVIPDLQTLLAMGL
jgi:hypothetical protein